MLPGPSDVTQLLQQGDRPALDALLPLVYDELRTLAHRHLRGERADHTLRTTALVHECYLRLVDQERTSWRDRAQFYALASKAMRHLLVDHARRRNAQKRGNGAAHVPLEPGHVPAHMPTPDRAANLLDLDSALTALARCDARLEAVVECRFFGGLTADETAEALDRSKRSVERDWARARAYLFRALDDLPNQQEHADEPP